MQTILFSPLGGAQDVGASCYFLKLGGDAILLDCGVGNNHFLKYAPDFYFLLENGLLQSMKQLSKVFISHAHLDHVGHLGELLCDLPDTAVYMTEKTKYLTALQLKNCPSLNHHKTAKVNRYASMLEKQCTIVAFRQEIPFGDYTVTFLPAGHIPGAMMVLIKYKGKNILYTGDYSLHSTALTDGCTLPNEKIDVLITCGLHARRSNHIQSNTLDNHFRRLENHLQRGYSVICSSYQLSKGAELLVLLNKYFKNRLPIYIDNPVAQVINQLENNGVPIMAKNNYLLKNGLCKAPAIIITNKFDLEFDGNFKYEQLDFSLHDNFQETVDFIKKINPVQAVIVHSPPNKSLNEISIEQVLMRDAECRTQFFFPSKGDILEL